MNFTDPGFQISTKNIVLLRNLLRWAPVAIGFYRGKEHVIELANELMLKYWDRTSEDVIGKPLFAALPETRGQGFEASIDNVYNNGDGFASGEVPVSIMRHGVLETLYVKIIFEPIREEDGTISGVMGVAHDITDMVLARKKVVESESRFRDTITQVPVGITIFRGKYFVVETANDAYLQIVDKKKEDFIGKPLFDSLPEVKGAVEPLLTGVLETGVPYFGYEFEVPLNRYGGIERTYFNFTYQPLRESDGSISGVIVIANEITNLVETKQKLAESEKQFRNLITQSPVGMAIFRGKDMIIEIANDILLTKFWRRKKEDVQRKKLMDVFPELREQQFPLLLGKVFTTGVSHQENEAPAYINGPDGMKKFYLDFEYAPLSDSDGSVSGIMVTVHDVTEKVLSRLKLKEAEERLRLATEGTRLATWDLDLQTDIIVHSPRLPELFGYDNATSLTHRQLLDSVHPEDLDTIVRKAFDAALQSGYYYYEARIVWPNNTTHWVRTQGTIVFDPNGTPLRMLGTMLDITEHKLTINALTESEERFRLLADSMPQQIWTSDPSGNLNYFNRSVYDFAGLTHEQLLNQGWLEIVHPEDREENIKRWAHSIATGEDFILEHRFRRHDGQYRWQLSRALAQRDNQGKIQMWVGTSTDIHDQKIMTDELEKKVQERTIALRQANQELERSNTELASFSYVASHDLQEPLRKIQTFAGKILASESQNLSEQGKDYFNRMKSASHRMQILINDLLTYSRINTTEKQFELVDLNILLEDVRNDLRELIEEKNATIVSSTLPTLKAIPFQFRQLLTNLLSNSLKFSREGVDAYIIIEVDVVNGSSIASLTSHPTQMYYRYKFTDNGIGFEDKYAQLIFQVFQRLHGKNEYSGTGIGLAICKKIAENHNGFITAHGDWGKGATFMVYIPF